MRRSPDPAAAEVAAPLSGSRMKLIARAIAGCPDRWPDLVRMDPDSRWHLRLHTADDHDIWLESWLPGQETGWHDHAGTSGVLVVARGELEERVSVLNGVMTQVRHIPEGAARRMRRRQVHHLANVSLAPAVSVHVYSPPLGATRGYEIGAMGLMRSPWTEAGRRLATRPPARDERPAVTARVERTGDVVRRPAEFWSPAVHDLLGQDRPPGRAAALGAVPAPVPRRRGRLPPLIRQPLVERTGHQRTG